MRGSILVSVCAALLFAPSRAFADVLIVAPGGQGEYVSIQDAITAAASGDTLWVRAGGYPGFTIAHKSIHLVVEPGSLVTVYGRVQILDLAPWNEVSLADLTLSGDDLPSLVVRDCTGAVRLRSCDFQVGAPAASVLRCPDVAFVDCTFSGSEGTYGGYDGGAGLSVIDSSVALHGCLLDGGDGGPGADATSCFGGNCTDGGQGGAGLSVAGSFLYAADCHFAGSVGGPGGTGFGYCDCNPGEPGPAIWSQTGATTVLLDCSTQGGILGIVETLPGLARRLEVPAQATEFDVEMLVCRGQPGDRVRVLASPRADFDYVALQRGVDLIAEPFPADVKARGGPAEWGRLRITTVELVLPPSGLASIPLRVLPFEPGEQAALHHLQAIFHDAAGAETWSNVALVVALSQSAYVPDCLPCAPPTVVHVDDDAAEDPLPGDPTVGDPLEDGSVAHPFDAIQEALSSVATGGEVIVADGYYTGIGNRRVSFYGRALRLRSANGADACVVDAQGDAQVLRFTDGEPLAASVRGMTLRGASASGIRIASSSPTIEDCVIEGNSTTASGGGIYIQSGRPRIARCRIAGNVASINGGGIYATGSHTNFIHVTDCTIVGNTAASGGGVYSVADVLKIEGTTLSGNQGIGVVAAGAGAGTDEVQLRNSILWGDAPRALHVTGSAARLRVGYCDVEGGQAGVTGSGTLLWQLGNIELDPRFVDVGSADYHLRTDSPCLNAGDPAFVPAPGQTDIDGEPRVIEAVIDQGSDETFIDCDGNGVPDSGEGYRFDSEILTPIGFDHPALVAIGAPPVAHGAILFQFWARADLGDPNERILVRVNNAQFGSIFSAGAHDCPAFEDRTTLVVPAASFNAAVGGGDAVVTLLPSSTVDALCDPPSSYLYFTLRYDGDCDGSGVLDSCEIARGLVPDANGNGVPDACE